MDDNDFFIMFNGSGSNVNFRICDLRGAKKWVRAVDTGLLSPGDILEAGGEAMLNDPYTYEVRERSVVILVSRLLS